MRGRDEVGQAAAGNVAKVTVAWRARRVFWCLWGAITLLKLLIAAHLPLFVDEAFYWQEGRHLAAAYSDLPGLTAWMARLGVELGGNHTLALRAPFLLVAALVPLLVVRIAAREAAPGGAAGGVAGGPGASRAWWAGCFALLLPLVGTLGLLALPDAMMALATLLCIDAGARLLRKVDASGASELALGLAIGALSHYRFIAVIGVGLIALLLLADGRRVLRDIRVLTAVAFGATAWAPLLAWNFDNADAGLRFQLVDRHPWAFQADGVWFIAIQALLVTPLLFAALAQAAWRGNRSAQPVTRYFALLGGLLVLGFFLLGFFADTQRVSFHWPLPGYLALLLLLPAVLERWPRWARIATWATAALGLIVVLGYYVAVSIPAVRAGSATQKWYPSNFAGWDELAVAVRRQRAAMPYGTRIVADNFKLGAELGFALGNADIAVLDHPLNHSHGRAPQLRLWGLQPKVVMPSQTAPVLLVVGATDVAYKDLLRRYHDLCKLVGPLPPPRVLNIDHGSQRFLLFALEEPRRGSCTTPAMAWIDTPVAAASVGRVFGVSGWAFKDGVGLARVEVLLDGHAVATATYGSAYPGLQSDWTGSNDPQHPRVGFNARVDVRDLPGVAPGRHWLGLRLHGRDGSTEEWPEQPILIAD